MGLAESTRWAIMGENWLALKPKVERMATGSRPWEESLMVLEKLPGLISTVTGRGVGQVMVSAWAGYQEARDKRVRMARRVKGRKSLEGMGGLL
jgi:hypothetical protein